MQLKIHKLEDSDNLQALADLLSRVYVSEGYTPAEIAKRAFTSDRLAESDLILIAKSGDKIIGMISGATTNSKLARIALSDEFEIQNLVVDPFFRGYGVANELCRAIHEHAAQLGYKKLVLATLPAMKSAHLLYSKLGYQRTVHRDFIRDNREFLVFEKVLE